MPADADGRPEGQPYIHDPFYEMGDLGYLVDAVDEESAPTPGTHFYALEGPEGILLDGRAALYGQGDIGVSAIRSTALFGADLTGLPYEWDLDDLSGERWPPRHDPWDGP